MVGIFATSTAGHDKNQLYIILKEDAEYVYLSDGNSKTTECPKKKNKKHIQPIRRYSNTEIKDKLEQQEPIKDEEIKRAIKLYKKYVS